MKSLARIVTVTDCTDVAFNEIRAAIISQLSRLGKENSVIVEPPTYAKEFSLINGAFLTRLLAESYLPEQTIFLIILNPLRTKRADRARIVGTTKNGFRFVGENTGVLSWLIKDFGLSQVYETETKGLDGKGFVSFGGKYFHAPVAARLAAGIKLAKLGRYFDPTRITHLSLKKGTVVHIDNFGVPKIYGRIGPLVDNQKVVVYVNGRKKKGMVYSNSMKNLKDGTWALYKGSSLTNLPEIGKVRNLGTAKELNIKIGDIVSWKLVK